MAFMFVRLGSSVAWKDRVVFTHTAVQTPALAVEAERIVAVYYLGAATVNMFAAIRSVKAAAVKVTMPIAAPKIDYVTYQTVGVNHVLVTEQTTFPGNF